MLVVRLAHHERMLTPSRQILRIFRMNARQEADSGIVVVIPSLAYLGRVAEARLQSVVRALLLAAFLELRLLALFSHLLRFCDLLRRHA
jgi:hypothetical protein